MRILSQSKRDRANVNVNREKRWMCFPLQDSFLLLLFKRKGLPIKSLITVILHIPVIIHNTEDSQWNCYVHCSVSLCPASLYFLDSHRVEILAKILGVINGL